MSATRIRVGSNYKNSGGKLLTVEEVISHPNYSGFVMLKSW